MVWKFSFHWCFIFSRRYLPCNTLTQLPACNTWFLMGLWWMKYIFENEDAHDTITGVFTWSRRERAQVYKVKENLTILAHIFHPSSGGKQCTLFMNDFQATTSVNVILKSQMLVYIFSSLKSCGTTCFVSSKRVVVSGLPMICLF